MVSKFGNAVNVCFQNERKILSIALDDSCGRLSMLSRSSIEIQRKGADGDVTPCNEEIFGELGSCTVISANEKNLAKAFAWLGKTEWGFDAMGEVGGVPV